MTIMNSSAIAAELVLDLRTGDENPDGIECLSIEPVDELDESVMHSVHSDANGRDSQTSGIQDEPDSPVPMTEDSDDDNLD